MPRLPLSYVSDHALVLIALLLLLATVYVGRRLLAPRNRLPGRGNAGLPMKSLGANPTLQLELARSGQDIEAILCVGDTARNIRDSRMGNLIDTLLFVPSYVMLLLTLDLLGARGSVSSPRSWFWMVAALAAAAAVSDWMENRGISATLRHLASSGRARPGDAIRIAAPSLAKWTLLSIVLFALGALWLQHANFCCRFISLPLFALGGMISWGLAKYARERAVTRRNGMAGPS